MLLAPGAQLGPYRILGLLGGGGMGEVYQATDTRLGRTVAVKVLQGSLAESAAHRDRFEREARLISQLNHPHICTLHDVGTDADVHYLVMEYVDGVTLEGRLRQGALSSNETIAYATQIADALHVAHRHGIVHRDLKPANIMLTRSGVKLLDFGLAKLSAASGSTSGEGQGASNLTEQGTILGTTQYMAPEQLEGKEADARTDIFAFGAIVYEMLTGKRAFEGGSQASLIAAILKDTPRRISAIEPSVAPGLESTILRCLAKEPDDRWQDAGDLLYQLRADSTASTAASAISVAPSAAAASRARPRWLLPASGVAAVAAAVAIGAVVLGPSTDSGVGATPENLARLESLIDDAEWEAAWALAREIEAVSPDDPELGELQRRSSSRFTFTSDPPGARIFRRPYDGTEDDWVELGTTPVREVVLPIGLSRVRLEREGYEPVLRNVMGGTTSATRETQAVREQHFTLDREGTLPAGTVRVPGWRLTLQGAPVDLAEFFIGKYEVTNREYKEFVDRQGYERPDLWQHPIVQDGRELPWQDAMKLFTDQTGLPGPSTWIAGDYPEGQDDYPVSGVSWYEAAAFARFAGRELPTVHHWQWALNNQPVGGLELAWVLPKSNLVGTGPAPVGRFDAPSWSGVYDMAGNVREWTQNAVGEDRFALGGGWSDNRYMGANERYSAAPLDRSAINGFRLAVLRDEPGKLAAASAAVPRIEAPDWSAIAPVSDETFEAYESHYAYEPAPLDAVSEAAETFRSWTRERITFDAAYDGVRMVLYLYLPLNGSPPYQTVVYFPAGDAWLTDSLDQSGMPLDWLIKSGRAVAVPVLRGTYERRDGTGPGGATTVTGRDAFVKVVKDARRSIDYLVTRPDVAADSIVYYGLSAGAAFAPLILAQEPRFRVAVLSLAGVPPGSQSWLPELRPTVFLPRVTLPVLVFSGDLDTLFPLETSAKPFFDLLGTPAADKEQVIIPGGHTVLTTTQARRTLEFLDERLGRVVTSGARQR